MNARPGFKVAIAKTFIVAIAAAFIITTSGWLIWDWYANGDPFCVGGCTNYQVTAVYPSTVSLATGGPVYGSGDLRVGVFFTFNTTIIAGQDVQISARVLIPPTADARIRTNSDAIAVVIPSASASEAFNDTTFDVPNQFNLGLVYVGNESGSLVYGELGGSGIPIYFPDQGNYPIYVIVESHGFSSGLIDTGTPVHVEPRSMEQTLLLAREQRTFTFGGLVFATLGSAVLLFSLYQGSMLESSTYRVFYPKKR